ncbi:MAG: hypothetical protein K2N50_00875 [Clostridia bacterium]|nr:hypothetical protein [Clostridia bacterium]MDE7256496.1 hypothetical protein [Clostridia bacterium]
MKTFKYKFTRLIKALMIVAMVLCVLGFAINLFYCITNGTKHAADPVYPVMQYTLMFFVTVVLFALLLSIMLQSAYIIDGKYFKTQFGFIVSKYDVEKIDGILLDRKTNKLTVNFSGGEFIVIVVKQEWYDEFITALLEANPKIEYTVNSLDKDDKNKEA